MRLTETWMPEKSFAATRYSCHDEILDLHVIMQSGIMNFNMAYDKVMSKLKDFKGVYVPASLKSNTFSG